MAVNFSAQQSGTNDVGWVTASGKTVNVTAPIDGNPSSFNYVPMQRGATFDPGSNQLWWFQKSGTVPYGIHTLESGADVQSVLPTPCGESATTGNTGPDPGNWPIGVCEQGLPNPDATAYINTCDLGSDQAFEGSVQVATTPPPVGTDYCNETASQGGGWGTNISLPEISQRECILEAWATNNEFICYDNQQLWLITFDSAFSTATMASIVNFQGARGMTGLPVVSPDGQTVSFIACLSQDCGLYNVPIDGSSQPSLVTTLPSGSPLLQATFVAWK
jgi:hypothetical protein